MPPACLPWYSRAMEKTTQVKRFLILKVITTHFHRHDALESMTETENLVDTFGGTVVYKDIQHRVKPDSNTYIGPGKLEEISTIVETKDIDVVVIDDLSNSGQLFRLEKSLWEVNHLIKVWDRVDLILNIFELHAVTAEAKLQIELARLQHEGPRAYGLGKDRLSRQGGGIGTRGSGETNIEVEKRIIKDKTSKIKRQLKKLSKQKKSLLHKRREVGLGPVALVGYTSAGKTTLFNALTGKSRETQSGLFTTLDTVVGKMKTADDSVPVLISDTIGFIQDLPPQLIEAFKSTLLESLEAELILHVVDASDPYMLEKISVVEQILESLHVSQPILMVFNKIDQASDQQTKQAQRYAEDNFVFVSAKKGNGLKELKAKIITNLSTDNG